MENIRDLGDRELHEKIVSRVSEERQITTEVLHLLREVEHRRIFADYGCSSLFEYAVRFLKYDESAAHRRISAMRLLKETPDLEEKIDSGLLSLSVVAGAQKLFRQEAKIEKPLSVSEKREVMKSLEGKSAREAEKILLSRSSEPVALRPEKVMRVSETHSEMRFLANDETLEKFERIRGLLGHSHTDMSLAELIEAMAKIVLEKLDPARESKRTRGALESNALENQAPTAGEDKMPKPAEDQAPQSVATSQPSRKVRRYIPAAVRREVWKRAESRCVLCRGIYRLQVDHIIPVALGGTTVLENLRLLCFHCNQRQADLRLGRGRMEAFRQRPRRTGTAKRASVRAAPPESSPG